MSNKPEHSNYFKELIKKLKELRVSADNGEIIVPNDTEDVLEFNEMELPFSIDVVAGMTTALHHLKLLLPGMTTALHHLTTPTTLHL